jgi:hypothetical protein
MELINYEEDDIHWVLLTSTSDFYEAKILCTKLESEDITHYLENKSDSSYTFTFNNLALCRIFVADFDLEKARLILNLE